MPPIAHTLGALHQLGTLRHADLPQLISSDAALCGQLLRLANAPGRGARGQIGTLGAALHLLGRDALMGMVTEALSLRLPAQGVLPTLWREQLLCAALARQLHGRRGEGRAETAYVAGLLHDVGGLVLLARWPQRYGKLLQRARREPNTRRAAERQRFGVDAAQLGAELLRQWGLPEDIVAAVRGHADAQPPAAPLAASVWRACRMAQQAAVLSPPWSEAEWMRAAGLDLRHWRELVEPIDAITAHPRGAQANWTPAECGPRAGIPLGQAPPGPPARSAWPELRR